MEFFRKGRIGPTGQRSSRNVLSLRTTHFYTSSPCQNRLARTGIILITVRVCRPTSERLLTCFAATQYCDGLRGAFIVEDPDDTHKLLYDVDDGLYIDTFIDLAKADCYV